MTLPCEMSCPRGQMAQVEVAGDEAAQRERYVLLSPTHFRTNSPVHIHHLAIPHIYPSCWFLFSAVVLSSILFDLLYIY